LDQAQEIDLREYLAVFRRRFGVFVFVIVGSVATAAILSYFALPKVYSASTTLIVFKKETPIVDYSTLQLHRQLVKTYGELAKSRRVAEQVIDDLNLPLNYSEFAKKVNVKLFRDTELLEMVVEDDDPYVAASIANVLAQVFIDEVVELMHEENVAIIDQAVPSTEPVRPRPLFNMAIAGAVGVLVGLALVFLLEQLDNTIDTTEDVERHLALPVLGMIPKIDPAAEARRVRERAKRQSMRVGRRVDQVD
jgi:capsular polysaccharide biosynthesis protein